MANAADTNAATSVFIHFDEFLPATEDLTAEQGWTLIREWCKYAIWLRGTEHDEEGNAIADYETPDSVKGDMVLKMAFKVYTQQTAREMKKRLKGKKNGAKRKDGTCPVQGANETDEEYTKRLNEFYGVEADPF